MAPRDESGGRAKQYLTAIRPKGDVLTLETMFFTDEVRKPAEDIEELPTEADLRERDVSMAVAGRPPDAL